MKRLLTAIVILLAAITLTGCNRISISYEGDAVLNYTGAVTQVLTKEETETVKAYLSDAAYSYNQLACSFREDISITFGDQSFAIAYDDCASIWLPDSNAYYTIPEEARAYIVSLFVKYVGHFP